MLNVDLMHEHKNDISSNWNEYHMNWGCGMI